MCLFFWTINHFLLNIIPKNCVTTNTDQPEADFQYKLPTCVEVFMFQWWTSTFCLVLKLIVGTCDRQVDFQFLDSSSDQDWPRHGEGWEVGVGIMFRWLTSKFFCVLYVGSCDHHDFTSNPLLADWIKDVCIKTFHPALVSNLSFSHTCKTDLQFCFCGSFCNNGV